MRRLAPLLLALATAAAFAQDAARGQRLFSQTAAITGAPVAACSGCHADSETLRAMLSNLGVASGDATVIRRVLQAAIAGALPGARGAKAQYRGVLSEQDLADLAAYLARVQTSAAAAPLARR